MFHEVEGERVKERVCEREGEERERGREGPRMKNNWIVRD